MPFDTARRRDQANQDAKVFGLQMESEYLIDLTACNGNMHMPAKSRRAWYTAAFVLSPLTLGLFWCAFIEQEMFAAFPLGVLGSILFGAVLLARFLLKKTAGHPVGGALFILGCTIASILVAFIVGSVVTVALYGDSDEAFNSFGFVFTLVAPFVLVLGLVLAGAKFVKERRHAIHDTAR